ncbi:four helix bundle protein [Pedobacter suwonensis]|uniref:four helix bundle protein n=2 Tax=Pedobacter suwonensis TaxID=332999 RepID=UPI00382CE748
MDDIKCEKCLIAICFIFISSIFLLALGKSSLEILIFNLFKMNEKTTHLLERTFRFGVDVLKFLGTLPYNFIFKVPMLQLSRCSTSIGANYEEAQGAVSKRDFIHKTGISYREARESVYWLRTLSELYQDEKISGRFRAI